ncbi:MAG TPA: hypothetical protein VFY87_29965 [Geminicoccaceae bacterium]|nr:hypothetical protein [Geminicoccaceae bacterium]
MLAWSEGRFGLSARSRYAVLLVTAMGDVAAPPARLRGRRRGVVDIPGLIHERMLRGRALRRLLRGIGYS